jgi:two-component system, chemotaxis family, sensor kinase CheA
MNDLRQNFLAESINNLSELQKVLATDFSENRRLEAFRVIHTVKGTSQTFELKNSAELADELENMLANRETSGDENHKNLLLEGIGLLIDSLNQENSEFPASFVEKLHTKNQKSAAKSNILLTNIPLKFYKSLSESEQKVLISALRQRKNILSAEVGFDAADFAGKFRSLRNILSETGEIIAALPSQKYKDAGKIGFQIYLASDQKMESLQKKVKSFSAEIVSYNCAKNASSDLFAMFSQIAAHGKSVAEQLKKEVNITILANEIKLSAERTKIIFDTLLHLVRNAVDHAIEKRGSIKINLFADDEGLFLTVSDNGKGVDLKKLRSRAIARNLVSDEEILDERQLLELIFTSELSTAEHLSEISGRGVGLDAVKNSVEKSNGKISVKSRQTFGTTFEIFLPN